MKFGNGISESGNIFHTFGKTVVSVLLGHENAFETDVKLDKTVIKTLNSDE